ncbi:hypothetical protein J132_04797 [Termitomyces sp. J132]|nr:hypothetical protein J132_04797 [Termitomyces sp. J132]
MIRGLTARSMAIIEAIVKRRDAAPGVQATVALPLPARQSSTAFISRCEEFNKWFPKNRMPYFPTEDHTTWATAPPKRPTPPLGTCPPAQPIPTTCVSASKADHPPQPAQTTGQCPLTWKTQKTPADSCAPSCLRNLDEFGFTQVSHHRSQRGANPPASSD